MDKIELTAEQRDYLLQAADIIEAQDDLARRSGRDSDGNCCTMSAICKAVTGNPDLWIHYLFGNDKTADPELVKYTKLTQAVAPAFGGSSPTWIYHWNDEDNDVDGPVHTKDEAVAKLREIATS